LTQFVMVIPCALRTWIEDGTGSRHDVGRLDLEAELKLWSHEM